MRILFLTHYFPPEGNAPATRVHALCKRWVEMGHEVTVITCAPNVPDGKVYDGYKNKLVQREDIDGIKVVRVWTWVAANKGTLLRTINFVSFQMSATIASLFQKRPGVVIATSPQFFCGWAGVFASWIKRAPFVLEIRDIWPASIAAVGAAGMAPGRRRWLLRTLEWLERRLYGFSKHIVTVGECYRRDLLDRNVPEKKISVITNGVDADRFTPCAPDETIRQRHGLTDNHLVVSYIGTVGMASGLGVVLRAAKQYKERGNERVRFMIVGDGAIREDLETQAKAEGLDNVIFAGRRPKEEMTGYLSATDVCLIHLIKRDLFKSVLPSKIFEATAMRRPIVLGVEGFACELIRESNAGLCIEPESEGALIDAVDRLAADTRLRQTLGDNGYDYFVPRYDIDKLTRDYAGILGDIAARRPVAALPAVEESEHTAPTPNSRAGMDFKTTAGLTMLPTIEPAADTGVSFASLLAEARPGATPAERPVVCVQGLGHVGSAMAVAVANARDAQGQPLYNVIGVELDNDIGNEKVCAINAGRMPFAFTDGQLSAALKSGFENNNLIATINKDAYELASVVLVDVPFDVADINGTPHLPWDHFKSALRTIGTHIRPGALILVETTVPPGACEKVAAPLLAECFRERGLPEDGFLLAHSYERVMPGPQYYESIVNFWRVFAGHTDRAGDAAQAFLSSVIDTDNYPMTRLQNTTASETAKVLENSYRATNIAFVEEWGRFAESVGIDLFEVINAIRVRPTHNNLRQPGFGVGGYCLTKDPLMAKLAGQELFDLGLDFPFSTMAVKTNNAMPIVSLDYIDGALGGLAGKRILLLGVSYRPGVGDTRYSPSEIFVREAQDRGATVDCQDPLIDHWREFDLDLPAEIPGPAGYDAVVFAVGHKQYMELDLKAWLAGATPLIFDSNCVLSAAQRRAARDAGCDVRAIGRGGLPSPSPVEATP